MTSAPAPRGLRRSVISTMLLVGILAATVPTATVTAQTESIDAARAYLSGVPGLREEQLSISSDAIGETEPGADIAWAASGQIEFTNKLRKWLKSLVESDTGWGRLPAKDVKLLITFVKMEQAPRKKGDSTAVIHLGLAGDDSLVKAGLQLDPGNGARLLHSFGLWQRDGQFYTQNGTSPVTVGGVNWFGDAAKGAGGIDLPDGVIVNVTPIPKWTKRYRIQSESVKPVAGAPGAASRDIVFGPGGSEWITLGGALAEGLVDCFSTFVSPLPSGSRQVEMNLQTAERLDAKTLDENLKLAGYDTNGVMLGTIDAAWTSLPSLGIHRGLAEVTDPAVESVDVYGADDAAGVMSAITRAHWGTRIGLEGVGVASGQGGCGQMIAPNLKICDKTVTDTVATFLGVSGSGLDGVPVVTADGSTNCDISSAGKSVARAIVGNQPVVPDDVARIAAASDCATSPFGGARVGSVVMCDEFMALLYFIEMGEAFGVPAAENVSGLIISLIFPLPLLPEITETIDEDFDPDKPIPIESGFLAKAEAPFEALEALARQADWSKAVPSAAG